MIKYNVTINIDDDVHDEWLNYMLKEHIPDVMKTGCFKEYSISRLITKQPGETGTSYSIQYQSLNIQEYYNYQEKFAPKLQKEHIAKFSGKFVAFRSLMEDVD